MTIARYALKTTADAWDVSVARDILNTADSYPEARAWAEHMLTLPVTGNLAQPVGHDDRPESGSGSSRSTGSGSKPQILATDKQISALINMGGKKEIGEATVRHLTADVKVQDIVNRAADSGKIVTKGEASAALDFLFAAPWKRREIAPAAKSVSAAGSAQRQVITEDGMYTLGDRIIKVQIAKNGSRNLYAKELIQDGDNWSFEYAPGLINRMTGAIRMTLEEAKTFGRLYGVCCVCGRDLTDETSVAEGIGPVCAGRV